jgi:hypothetical protein
MRRTAGILLVVAVLVGFMWVAVQTVNETLWEDDLRARCGPEPKGHAPSN